MGRFLPPYFETLSHDRKLADTIIVVVILRFSRLWSRKWAVLQIVCRTSDHFVGCVSARKQINSKYSRIFPFFNIQKANRTSFATRSRSTVISFNPCPVENIYHELHEKLAWDCINVFGVDCDRVRPITFCRLK